MGHHGGASIYNNEETAQSLYNQTLANNATLTNVIGTEAQQNEFTNSTLAVSGENFLKLTALA